MPGDDLVDDFVPDELVALSGDEDEQDGTNTAIFSDAEDQTAPQALAQGPETKKRKRREKEKQRKVSRSQSGIAFCTHVWVG